ncbi:hypothetical protein [Amycolatopsis kentuckyensis]|uniref:hypothetical protein n=1 Tax=Amycolatopsis kentuckyensis TaxID=218823 RepID=UPI003564C44A
MTSGAGERLAGSTWRATVIVEPHRWLGMEFEAADPATGRGATDDIDTDVSPPPGPAGTSPRWTDTS